MNIYRYTSLLIPYTEMYSPYQQAFAATHGQPVLQLSAQQSEWGDPRPTQGNSLHPSYTKESFFKKKTLHQTKTSKLGPTLKKTNVIKSNT